MNKSKINYLWRNVLTLDSVILVPIVLVFLTLSESLVRAETEESGLQNLDIMGADQATSRKG